LKAFSSGKALKGVFQSYLKLGMGLLRLFFFLVVLLAVSCAISFPLWTFAAKFSRLYTIVTLILLLGFFVYMIVRRGIRRNGLLILFSAAFVVGFYFILVTFFRGYGYAGTAALIIYFFLFGFFLNAVSKKSSS
jgi:hypothetical protein